MSEDCKYRPKLPSTLDIIRDKIDEFKFVDGYEPSGILMSPYEWQGLLKEFPNDTNISWADGIAKFQGIRVYRTTDLCYGQFIVF